MGVAYFISPEPHPESAGHIDCDVNGKTLANLGDAALDRVCREAGVRPLSEFFSLNPDEALAFLEGQGIDPPPGGLPPEQWFDAADGLRTFRALLARAPELANRRFDAEAVTAELERFIEVLTALAERGIRWHLTVDF